jgi:hypothetical protein
MVKSWFGKRQEPVCTKVYMGQDTYRYYRRSSIDSEPECMIHGPGDDDDELADFLHGFKQVRSESDVHWDLNQILKKKLEIEEEIKKLQDELTEINEFK